MTRSLTTAVKNELATNDIQEFGVVGADKDGNLLYKFEFDVEESL